MLKMIPRFNDVLWLLGVTLWGCSHPPSRVSAHHAGAMPLLEMTNTQLQQQHHNRLLWQATAARLSGDHQAMTAQQVQWQCQPQTIHERAWQLTAQTGRFDPRGTHAEFDEVTITDNQGTHVHTAHAIYDEAQGLLVGNSAVVVTTAAWQLTGSRWQAATQAGDIQIDGPIVGTLHSVAGP